MISIITEISNVQIEFILIIAATIGLFVAVYQLLRIKSYLGWSRVEDIGGIIVHYTLFSFGWLLVLGVLSILRRNEIITQQARDIIMPFMLLLIVVIIWSLSYRLHQWYMRVVRGR